MTFHVPTCACGHRQGEHKSGRSNWPHPMVYGICLVEGCACREFSERKAA